MSERVGMVLSFIVAISALIALDQQLKCPIQLKPLLSLPTCQIIRDQLDAGLAIVDVGNKPCLLGGPLAVRHGQQVRNVWFVFPDGGLVTARFIKNQ